MRSKGRKSGYTKAKVLLHVADMNRRIVDGYTEEQLVNWCWNDWFFLEFR